MALTKEQEATLEKFQGQLQAIVKEADYDEVYGYQLDSAGEFYDQSIADVILEKLLRANKFELEGAKLQLKEILKWRKEFNPLSAAFHETHDKKFDVISFITVYPSNPANEKVVTFNVYGNVTEPQKIFGDLDAFLRWRVGVMEKGIALLDLKDPGNNDYMVQIHDYKRLSFLRLDPDVKKGSKATIKLFQDYYPEVLSEKFFVNIPTILSWVFNFVSRFVSDDTRKKFKLLGDGKDVAKYLGSQVPTEYGGSSSHTLEEQRFEFDVEANENFKLSPYAAHLLGKQFTAELD